MARVTTKELYQAAYHRVRTFHSKDLYIAEDSYPIGFGCDGCEHYNHCWCEEDYNREHTAQAKTQAEANRLLGLPMPYVGFLVAAAQSYVHRLEYLDAWGRENYKRPLNATLTNKLRTFRTKKRWDLMNLVGEGQP